MPIWLSTSRFAPSPDILRTRQSIPEPSNEIVPAFRICWLWEPRFSSRLGMALSRLLGRHRPIWQANNYCSLLRLGPHPFTSVGANRLEASVQDPWISWGLHTRHGF